MLTEDQKWALRGWQFNFLPNTAGQRYEPLRTNLTDRNIINAAARISESERFEFGEYSHVVLKGTDVVIGYIGNESLELLCPDAAEPIFYRIPHKHLRRIFRAC